MSNQFEIVLYCGCGKRLDGGLFFSDLWVQLSSLITKVQELGTNASRMGLMLFKEVEVSDSIV